MTVSPNTAPLDVAAFQEQVTLIRRELGSVIVGQERVVDAVLTCILSGGHALLEGVPGLGKTLLVKTLAECLGLEFSRIQFTPDLMPADLIGTTVIDESSTGGRNLEFRPGPLFSQIVLADEVNRATPKTQSAMLEAMQEHRITVGRQTRKIGEPFFVLATQNPLEMEGTYPLPEAQLDRFFMKIDVPFPSAAELTTILERTTTEHQPHASQVTDAQALLSLQSLVRRVPVAPHLVDYVVRLVRATHPEHPECPTELRSSIRTGASPRGAQALLLGARVSALFDGRSAPAIEDVKRVAASALRHRILLSFEAEASGLRCDSIIATLLAGLPQAL